MIPFSPAQFRPRPFSRRSVVKAGSTLMAATAGLLPVAASAIRSLDRSRLSRTFTEDFSAPLSFYNPSTGQGRWKTSYDFGDQGSGPSSRTLPNELQIYCDQSYNGINPFRRQNGALTITAARNSAPDNKLSAGRAYTSGLITTSMSFRQCYGYFEMRAALPQGAGLWPAFWLAVPLDPAITAPQFPGEIDVMELLGKDPRTIYCSAHWPVAALAARAATKTMECSVGDTKMARSYGVLWTPQDLTWFVDDSDVASMRNPGLHRPMEILANLAVGGSWGGPPDASTLFPAAMKIEHIHACQISV